VGVIVGVGVGSGNVYGTDLEISRYVESGLSIVIVLNILVRDEDAEPIFCFINAVNFNNVINILKSIESVWAFKIASYKLKFFIN